MLALLRRSVEGVCGAHLHVIAPGNTVPFQEMPQRWRVVGNTVSDLTGPRFEPQTYRSTDECVTARPPGRLLQKEILKICLRILRRICFEMRKSNLL